MSRKNHDYTNGQSAKGSAYANFVQAEALGLCSTEVGMVVRMSDKLIRIATLVQKVGQVKDESIEDTLLDIINYSVLLAGYLAEKKWGGAHPIPRLENGIVPEWSKP